MHHLDPSCRLNATSSSRSCQHYYGPLMNNTCSLASFFLAAFACLLPTSANAQVTYGYDQPLSPWPVVSHVGNSGPLSFEQANAYSSSSAYSQANTYSQPLTFSQANTYSPGMYSQPNVYQQAITYSQPSIYSQPNITLVGGQSSATYSSIPAAPVEVAAPQLPVYSTPIQPPAAVQPQASVACST